MGAEKGGSKSGGFFHLFDWNRKSRKKLFSNGTISPEGTKQGKRSNDNLPSTRFRMIDEEDIVGVSSIKGSSDYSCASSVTDEEGNGTNKAPGVVARLMGLDSMPTTGVSEPYCTPFIDRRSLRDNHNLKRSPEFCTSSNRFNQEHNRAESYFRKPIEFRYQKMPSSPIEKFQTETLPLRSAKSLPISHHKLFSPIKNPGFTSAKNAAQIMEAAAKILETGPQASSGGKVSSFGSCSIPLKVCDPKESMAASQRTSRLLQLSRTPVGSSDVRFSRGEGGQSLNRSWNGAEDIVIFKPSPDSRELNPGGGKGKGRSISLAVQAKVNVQKREGLSTPLRSSVQKEHDQVKLNQPFNCQPNGQKNKQQKKPSTSNASGVLRQNNQKQNCQSSRSKLASNKSISNQQGRKVLSGDASSVKHKGVNKISANTRVGYRKEVLVTGELEREGSSSNKDFPQKKRLIERSFNNDKSSFVDNTFMNRHEECIQPNVVIEERAKRNKDNKDVTDVVSFTFTSPLVKPMAGSQSSTHVVESWDRRNGYWFDAHGEPTASDAKGKSLLSPGINAIKGDALSLLLEQKLRELTSGVDTSNDFMRAASFVPSFCTTEPRSVNLDIRAAEHGKLKHSRKDKPADIFDSCLATTNSQSFGIKQQIVEEVECSSSSSSYARKEQVQKIQNLSPLSIFEATFSTESCRSSESSGSTDGSKASSSSVQAQNAVALTFSKTTSSVEAEMELSDSASSTFADNSNSPDIRIATQFEKDKQEEIEYIREILCNGKLTSDDHLSSCFLSHAGTTLHQLVFDKMESKRNRKAHEKENIDGKVDRKLLFDCVNECLDTKCSLYCKAGYQAWAKGLTVTGKDLASEFCNEISGWRNMGDWMVDELVNKDMSTHLGRWQDFQIEAFEAGVDIEEDILSSLVDEVLADICIRS
ncbi:uncharacterized protein [Typha angustifolia]|uniref:uncharacterized protein isoform X1 n=1 Tax=Typha angustifolia TaxID=59011 RepID=UPI003C2DBF5F